MYPLILIPLSACILTSCTLSDFQNKTNTLPQASPTTTIKTEQAPPVTSTASNVSDIATILKDAYSEERLAEDIYIKMLAKYGDFTEVMNIIDSEEKHSEQVGRLLDVRGITRPTDYGSYSGTYDTLSKMLNTGLTQAIEVGVMVEVGDIDHLLSEYKTVEDADVRRVFENIGGSSFNHLRAFLRLAEKNNYTITTDFARYMTADEIHSTGPLKSKMTDLLKANNLPTYGTSNGGWKGRNR